MCDCDHSEAFAFATVAASFRFAHVCWLSLVVGLFALGGDL
jgi:hypothetical protein